MRKLCLFATVGLFMSLSGCANIGSAMGGNTGQTGEAWYVKTTGMGGLIFSSKIELLIRSRGHLSFKALLDELEV